jgi:hypothetical protein
MRWRDGEEGAVEAVLESERVFTHRGHIRERERVSDVWCEVERD